MTPADGFERVVRAAARRPRRRARACSRLLCAAGAALALGLQPSAATSTLAGRSSDTFQATERYRERFGDHAIVVLVRGPLQQLVLTENLGRLLGLEGCLSGNKPRGADAPGGARGPCAELARTKPVQVVYGPGTFINSAVGEIQDQLRARLDAKAHEARRAATARARRSPAARASRRPSRSGSRARPSSSSTRSSCATCSSSTSSTGSASTRRRGSTTPTSSPRSCSTPAAARRRRRRASPTCSRRRESAAIQVRLEAGPVGRRARAGDGAGARARCGCPTSRCATRRATRSPACPVLAEDLSDALAGSVARLLLVALVVMARGAGARVPPPAAARAAGGGARRGGGHVRADGAGRRAADDGVDRRRCRCCSASASTTRSSTRRGCDATGAARRARARVAVPTIATAALATAAGFLVLLLSPVPMVRGFGVAARGRRRRGVRVRADRRHRGARGARARRARRGALAPLGARGGRAARPRPRGRSRGRAAPARPARGAARCARRSRGRAACSRSGSRVAAIGWVVDTQTEVRSDLAGARAAGPAGGARPRHAAAHDRAWPARSTSSSRGAT